MKSFLRWFLDFLERKCPDKVTVRKADYDALVAEVAKVKAEVGRMGAALGMAGVRNPFER